MSLISASILSTSELRPVLLFVCTLDRWFAILADSSWQASMGHHLISLAHAYAGQLWCFCASPYFSQCAFHTARDVCKWPLKYLSTLLGSIGGSNLYCAFNSLWTIPFFKHGVLFPALFSQIEEFVSHLFCCNVPPGFQICCLLHDFDCWCTSARQGVLHLFCKCRLCLSVQGPCQVPSCCHCAFCIASKVSRTRYCTLWRFA